MIEIKNVTKKYGNYVAVEDISFKVEESSIYGLVGYNGAGKTTLLKTAAGILKPESGEVLFDSQNVYDNGKVRSSLLYVPDEVYFVKGASLQKMGKIYKGYFPNFNSKVFKNMTEAMGLDPKKNIGSFSKGMQRQAEVVLAMSTMPKYMLLDEVFDGIDPLKRNLCKKIFIEYMAETGCSMIMSSHNLQEIADLCDHVALINGKKLAMNVSVDDASSAYVKYRLIFDRDIDKSIFDGIENKGITIDNKLATIIVPSSFDNGALACALFGNTTSNFVFYGVYAVIIGVLFAFCIFFPIMRKSNVNFFFSCGIDRKTYFKNRALSSIIIMILTSAVPLMIDIIINIRYLGHADFIIHQGFFLFLEHFTYMLAGFSLMSIAMMACYTVTESLFFGAGLIWSPMLYIVSIEWLFQNFLRGYSQTATVDYMPLGSSSLTVTVDTLWSKLSVINPLIFGTALGSNNVRNNMYFNCLRSTASNGGVVNDFYYDNASGNVGFEKAGMNYILPILIWLVLSVLFIFISNKLLNKRKLENTALHSSNLFVTVFVSLEFSVLVATFFMPLLSDFDVIQSSVLDIFAGLICGIIAYFVFMSISRRKIKHGIKLVIPVGVSSIAVLVISVICISGGFGYSTYCPDIKDIDYATINSEYIDASGVMSTNHFNDGSLSAGTDQLYYGTYEPSGAYLGKFNTKDSIDKIEKIQNYSFKNRIAKRNEPYVTVKIKYLLKNGKTVNREYTCTNSDVSLDIIKLTQSSEYQKELEFLMSSKKADEKSSGTFNSEDESQSYFAYFANENNVKNALNFGVAYIVSNDAVTKTKIENTPALRDAILKDIEKVGYKKLLTSGKAPLGAINFSYDDSVQNYDNIDYMNDATYYIWDDMVNTINYLKSINKFTAFTDLSKSGEIEYVTVTALETRLSSELSLTALSTFESDTATPESYYEYQGSELKEADVLKTYNGKKITDSQKAQEIFNQSSIYSLCKKDGYVVLVKFKNNTYVTKYLSKEKAQSLLK